MNRSAASSSSAVVTPGWHFERSIRTQRAWSAPAAAIRSICSAVFRMITRLELLFHAERGEHRPDAVVDLLRRQCAVDRPQEPPLLVVGDQRLRLPVVLHEPVTDHLRLVVVADLELGSADVADPFVLGRIELDVEDVPFLDAHPSSAEAADGLVVGYRDEA